MAIKVAKLRERRAVRPEFIVDGPVIVGEFQGRRQAEAKRPRREAAGRNPDAGAQILLRPAAHRQLRARPGGPATGSRPRRTRRRLRRLGGESAGKRCPRLRFPPSHRGPGFENPPEAAMLLCPERAGRNCGAVDCRKGIAEPRHGKRVVAVVRIGRGLAGEHGDARMLDPERLRPGRGRPRLDGKTRAAQGVDELRGQLDEVIASLEAVTRLGTAPDLTACRRKTVCGGRHVEAVAVFGPGKPMERLWRATPISPRQRSGSSGPSTPGASRPWSRDRDR